MNLNEANMNDRPVWYKLYSARQAYQMPSTLPNDWDNLIDRMMIEPQIFEIYYKHYHKDSPVRPPYNEDSKKRLLCDLRSGKSHDRKIFCDALESKINGLTKKGWRSWIYNGLAFSVSMVMALPRIAYNLPKFVLGFG
ncbi:sphingomyelin phosphodiesterase-like [Copidosoma floridanum]|uniref:sphingomyelin phosphodiesterase-like n=1 Tax=Copidosoma floridanum TaxID=29053 RepID=UPI0006C9D826|nr:sphingomyelin phosphodiesterase-like [Copidosoma floridanum]